MSNQTDYVYDLYPALIKYPKILKILLDHRDEEGICNISQKKIALTLGLHQTAISKYLKRLEQYDKCVEKVFPAKYIVHRTNMQQYGPVSKVILFHNAVAKDINFISMKFKDQVDSLGISREAVVMAKHYFNQHL